MESVLKVVIQKDDSALKELLKSLAELESKAGGSTPAAFQKGADAAKSAFDGTKKGANDAADEVAKAAKREEEAALRAAEVERKARQATAEAAKSYIKLKEEYEGRSIDDIRAKIHSFEQETRVLRQARAGEEDAAVKKALQSQVNSVNTQLQLYRSLEKEKTGARTFMEQLEKHEAAGAEHLKASWQGVFKNIITGQGQYTAEIKRVEAEHKASMERMAHAATEEAKQEFAAKHAAIEKELADIKHRNEESKEHSVEGGGIAGNLKSAVTGSLGPLASIGTAGLAAGVGAALGGLFEKGMEKAERLEELKIGFMSAGQSAEQAEKSIKLVTKASAEVSHELLVNKGELDSATASYLKLGGSTKDLKERQEDIAALAKKAGIDMDSAAKMLAKATDPENQKNLSKFGINLAGVTDEAERSRIIHEKLKGTLEGMKEAADSPLGGFKRLQQSIGEIVGALGSLVFEAAGPFLSILSEIAKVIQDYVVPVVKTVINAAFFPLKTVIELVFGIIKGGISVFVSVAEWFGKVTGITNLLKEAWDGISNAAQSVVTWFNKAKETVSNLGSTITNFLGISDKSEKSTKDLAEAHKAEKEAVEATRKATDDYTESLSKNQEEQSKSAKQGQDNAIAAIVDIQHRLKTATGSEKELLQQRLQQWTQYGKSQAAAQEQQESEQHAAALAIGAAKDKENTSAAKKAAKDAYTARKEEIDAGLDAIRMSEEQAQLKGVQSDTDTKRHELDGQLQHDRDMLALAEKFHKDKKAALSAIFKDEEALRKFNFDQISKGAKEDQEDSLAQLSKETEQKKTLLMQSGMSESLMQKQFAEIDKEAANQQYQIKRAALENQIQAAKDNNQSTDALQRELVKLNAENDARIVKDDQDALLKKAALWNSSHAQLVSDEFEHRKQLIDIAKQYGANEYAILQAEESLSKAQEEARYEQEKKDRAADLADKQLGKLVEQALATNHQNKLTAIESKGANDRRKLQEQQIAWLTGPLAGAFSKAGDEINQKYFQPLLNSMISQKTFFGGLVSEIVTGLVKQTTTYISQRAAQLAADLVFGSAVTTAATAQAAISGAAWAPAAISASIATLGGADVAGSGAFAAAQAAGKALAVIPHAEGGLSLAAEYFPMAGGNIGLRGEDRPELHLPLNHPKTEAAIASAFGNGLEQKLDTLIHATTHGLSAVHNATVANGGDTVLNPYGVNVGLRQQQSIVNKRKIA